MKKFLINMFLVVEFIFLLTIVVDFLMFTMLAPEGEYFSLRVVLLVQGGVIFIELFIAALLWGLTKIDVIEFKKA
jgi:hypothetical protein